jgi:hypothetical protein
MRLFFSLLMLICSVQSGFSQFSEEHVITTDLLNPRYVHAADINGDTFIDVVVSSLADDIIAWFENDGLGNFGPMRIINQTLHIEFISSGDLDGDNDVDILATVLFDDLIIWFENIDGQGNFSDLKVINSDKDLPKTVYSADIDGDNDLDTFSASRWDGIIAWYENTTGNGDFTQEHIISNQVSSTTHSVAADLDGDDDLDILATDGGNQSIDWFENLDGQGNFSTVKYIAENLTGPQIVIATNLDGDNDMDVVSLEFGGDTLAWYENLDGLGNFGVKNTITSNINAPFYVVSSDLDNDNDQDLISLSGADDYLAWFENDGLGNFSPMNIIQLPSDSGPRSIDVADFDGDTYEDIVYATILTDPKVAWIKNETYLNINSLNNDLITISPNPVKNILLIENNSNIGIKSIKAFDILGRLVFQEYNQFDQINVSNLDSGVLFVHIETDRGKIIKKIIKE